MFQIIAPIELRNSSLLGFKVNSKDMHAIQFSIGCKLDNVPEMNTLNIGKNIDMYPAFKNILSMVGVPVDEPYSDRYGKLLNSFEQVINNNKGVITITEVNPIDVMEEDIKKKLFIKHDNKRYANYLSILSSDNHTYEYIEDIKKKLSNITIVDKKPIRRPTIDYFSDKKYTEDNINEKLTELYKFFSIKGNLSSSVEMDKIYLHNEGLYKIEYKTLVEFSGDVAMDLDIVLGGWVYHSSSASTIYKVYGTEVVSIPTKYSTENDGYIIRYENGEQVEVISNSDFISMGFYRDFNVAQHVSSENHVDGFLSKQVSELRDVIKMRDEEIERLKSGLLDKEQTCELLESKIKKITDEMDKIKYRAEKDILNKEVKNLELKKKYSGENDWLSNTSGAASNAKNIALSLAAIVGAGFAINSYFSE